MTALLSSPNGSQSDLPSADAAQSASTDPDYHEPTPNLLSTNSPHTCSTEGRKLSASDIPSSRSRAGRAPDSQGRLRLAAQAGAVMVAELDRRRSLLRSRQAGIFRASA